VEGGDHFTRINGEDNNLRKGTERRSYMKRLLAVTMGIMLSASLISSANASPAKPSASPDKGSAMQHQPQGITNAKKVMKARFVREKKMTEVRKKAQVKRHQAKGTN
jgi:hypothetical protein